MLLTLLVVAVPICIYSSFSAFHISSNQTTVYVNPDECSACVGEKVVLNVCISDVNDLYGWQFKLRWNARLLNVSCVTEGTFLKNGGSTFFTYKLNNTVGCLVVGCTLLGKVQGVSGSGCLASVEFYVKSVGECVIDIYDTILLDSTLKTISHISVDGFIRLYEHDVAVVEVAVFRNIINVTVVNKGDFNETFDVSVYYSLLSDPLLEIKAVSLPPKTKTVLTFIWRPTQSGVYEIRVVVSPVDKEVYLNDNALSVCVCLSLDDGTSGSDGFRKSFSVG